MLTPASRLSTRMARLTELATWGNVSAMREAASADGVPAGALKEMEVTPRNRMPNLRPHASEHKVGTGNPDGEGAKD